MTINERSKFQSIAKGKDYTLTLKLKCDSDDYLDVIDTAINILKGNVAITDDIDLSIIDSSNEDFDDTSVPYRTVTKEMAMQVGGYCGDKTFKFDPDNMDHIIKLINIIKYGK